MVSRLLVPLLALAVVFAAGCIQESGDVGYTCSNGDRVMYRSQCPEPPPEETSGPSLMFETRGASCAEKPDEINANVTQEAIVLSGSMPTPTPCYSIIASLAVDGTELTLNAEKQAEGGGVCIQCIASTPFKALIEGLPERYYRVTVKLDGEQLFSQTLDVRPVNETPVNFVCGDDICESSEGEDGLNCERDCCPGYCGDGVCNFRTRICPDYTENHKTCPRDCREGMVEIKPNIEDCDTEECFLEALGR